MKRPGGLANAIEIVEENRSLRWGAPGEHDYRGELDVGFVADGTSRLTVRLDTKHESGDEIDRALDNALDGIKSSLEGTLR